MESSSVCNHTSDNKIRRPRSGSPICSSRVWLQTELDDTKSYYQFIIKITISEKRRISKLWKKGKNLHKKLTKGDINILRPPRLPLIIRRQKHKSKLLTFECDWLILTTVLNVLVLLNCPITNCPLTNYPITGCPITPWQAN